MSLADAKKRKRKSFACELALEHVPDAETPYESMAINQTRGWVRKAVTGALQAACKAVCARCEEGDVVDEAGEWHTIIPRTMCAAAAIRRLMEGE